MNKQADSLQAESAELDLHPYYKEKLESRKYEAFVASLCFAVLLAIPVIAIAKKLLSKLLSLLF